MQLISSGFNNRITVGKRGGRFPEGQKNLKDSEYVFSCFSSVVGGSPRSGGRTEMLYSVRGHHSHSSDLVSELTVSSRKHF